MSWLQPQKECGSCNTPPNLMEKPSQERLSTLLLVPSLLSAVCMAHLANLTEPPAYPQLCQETLLPARSSAWGGLPQFKDLRVGSSHDQEPWSRVGDCWREAPASPGQGPLNTPGLPPTKRNTTGAAQHLVQASSSVASPARLLVKNMAEKHGLPELGDRGCRICSSFLSCDHF